MSIGSFVPEVWSSNLQVAVRKSLVFGSPMVVNRSYEGEIAQAGDTVKINAVGDPTVATYSPNSTTLSYEELNTASQNLVVDQAKSFAFKVDDVDKVLIPLKVLLDQANVPTAGRFCVIPPWLHGRLLRDDRFVRWDAAGTMTNGVQGNGAVGSAAGFTIAVSNNCALVTGDDYRVSAGVNDAITFAEQITETEALRLQTSFADAIRGLFLYGAKLVRPELVATAIASIT